MTTTNDTTSMSNSQCPLMTTLYNDTHAVVISRMDMGNQTLTLQPDTMTEY